MKETKNYVVSRHFSNAGNSKGSRNVKMVDKRLKKDMKN